MGKPFLRKIFGKGGGSVIGLIVGAAIGTAFGNPYGGALIGSSIGSGADAKAQHDEHRSQRRKLEQSLDLSQQQMNILTNQRRDYVRQQVLAAREQLKQTTNTYELQQNETSANLNKASESIKQANAIITLREQDLAKAKLAWDAEVTKYNDNLDKQIRLILEITQACLSNDYHSIQTSAQQLDTDLLEIIAPELLSLCHYDDIEAIQLILVNNLEMKLRAHYNTTIVDLAGAGNDEAIVEALELGANIEEKVTEGMYAGFTPLLMAGHCGRLSTVKLLLESNANITARNAYRSGLLYVTAWNGDNSKSWNGNGTAIIKYLFRHFHLEMYSQLNSTDNYNSASPLHATSMAGCNVEVAKLLIDKGANRTLTNLQGITPAEEAGKWGNQALYDVMRTHVIANIPDEPEEKIDLTSIVQLNAARALRDANGDTPVQVAIKNGNFTQALSLNRTQLRQERNRNAFFLRSNSSPQLIREEAKEQSVQLQQ